MSEKVKPKCPKCGSKKPPVRIRARNRVDWKRMCPDCGHRMSEKVKPKQTNGAPRPERPDYLVQFGWLGPIPTEGETPIRWKDCLVGKIDYERKRRRTE